MTYILSRSLRKTMLPNLAKESLKFYKEQLKFTDKIKPQVYYFFEHRNLSKGVKSNIKTTYKKFISKYNNFTVDNLKKITLPISILQAERHVQVLLLIRKDEENRLMLF